MSNQNDENTIVKKIQPYPFPISIHKDGKVSVAHVLKLAQKGAILNVNQIVVVVGSEFEVSFEIPVHKVRLSLLAKVVKTYDRAAPKDGGTERLAEIHFPKISADEIRSIYNFLVAIKQVRA